MAKTKAVRDMTALELYKECNRITRNRPKYKGDWRPANKRHKSLVDEVQRRVKALEKKAFNECWSYCYENGLTKDEQEQYDILGYWRVYKK